MISGVSREGSPIASSGYRGISFLFGVLVLWIVGCNYSLRPENPTDCFASSRPPNTDSVAGAPLFVWHPKTLSIPSDYCGPDGGSVIRSLDLSQLHSEREFTRNAQFVDLDGDGDQEILTRTMNENRVRALDPKSGHTLWVSPSILPATLHPQASDLVARDIDEDGRPEVIIVSYDGHVLCIDGVDGSLQWRRKLDYHINNPDLPASLANITSDVGLELALTVSNDFEWGPRTRPRINQMHNPSLLVLKADGSRAWIAKTYDASNSNGHGTWVHDIDADNLGEIFALGDGKIVVFDHDGTQVFTLPVSGGAHPDQIVFGEWTTAHPGDEIIYTDGIDGIVIASSTGQILQQHATTETLRGHLQDIVFISSPEGPRLLAQNIRDSDAKTILYDQALQPLWVAELGYRAAMQTTRVGDWNGDGMPEIATGSLSETHGRQCSLQIMDLNGTPLYWHRWSESVLCTITDVDDGQILLGVGSNEGQEGRYSLSPGTRMMLHIVDAL